MSAWPRWCALPVGGSGNATRATHLVADHPAVGVAGRMAVKAPFGHIGGKDESGERRRSHRET
jgi:hypothetical protein